MKIEFTPRPMKLQRYPWQQMKAIGDYFDVPAEFAKAARTGVSNGAWHQKRKTGHRFKTVRLDSGAIRVMLIDNGEVAHG